jgi:DNA-binding transcriptional MerR regulator
MDKNADAFRIISEAAEELRLPQHVLRFWETRFTQIRPMKRAGGRRYYRPEDMDLLRAIRHLLYDEGYTIKGVQRLLKERGARAVVAFSAGGAAPPADTGDGTQAAAGFEAGAGSCGEGDEAPALPDPDTVAQLRAALADIMEARRILAAVRSEA